MWRAGLALLVLLTIGVGASWADPPDEGPADPPAQAGDGEGGDDSGDLTDQQIADVLAKLAVAIKEAETVAEADELFSRASRFDRNDPAVNRAYLQRSLQFGQVQKAVYAARRLLKFNPSEGQAHAVLTYYEAYRGKLPQALPAGVRAAELLPDDPGVMHNAGALVAWYEHQDDASEFPRDTQSSIRRNRESWLEDPDFARAYDQVDELMGAYDQEIADLREKLAAIEGEIEEAQAKIKELAEQIDEADSDILGLQQNIDSLEYSLGQETNAYDAGQIRSQIARLRADVRELRRQREKWVREVREQLELLDDLERDQRKARKELDRAEDRKKRALSNRDRRLAWELPLVDGERIDLAAARNTGRGESEDATADAATRREEGSAEVRKYLQLAKQYANAGRKDLAIDMLEKVIILGPDTEQAVEAQELLEALKQASPPE